MSKFLKRLDEIDGIVDVDAAPQAIPESEWDEQTYFPGEPGGAKSRPVTTLHQKRIHEEYTANRNRRRKIAAWARIPTYGGLLMALFSPAFIWPYCHAHQIAPVFGWIGIFVAFVIGTLLTFWGASKGGTYSYSD